MSSRFFGRPIIYLSKSSKCFFVFNIVLESICIYVLPAKCIKRKSTSLGELFHLLYYIMLIILWNPYHIFYYIFLFYSVILTTDYYKLKYVTILHEFRKKYQCIKSKNNRLLKLLTIVRLHYIMLGSLILYFITLLLCLSQKSTSDILCSVK